ncbi:hypothetical protein HC031_03145 [Planosporangium thailandense]|uniref:DUF6457 domain-containing protein n=1 Tax=Planosporangium thailandense TaxID=765197 RepID=A0ABX0XTP8_9ACTN|nr:DUF6457 domain-containing protein [Planosporangium thailandense]NJC68727.1 hypothetical protein [Planosporangium thailandense]
MSVLDDWTAQVRAALELTPAHPDEHKLVLDIARDVAHGVLRPAAPVSAYLFGLAVGRGADPVASAAAITELAARWAEQHPAGEE